VAVAPGLTAPPSAGGGAAIPVVADTQPAPAARAAPDGAVTASPATAPPAGGTAAARAHTRQGSAYYDLNRFREAYTEFEQAYLLEQDPALLYNMGQCQRKLGNSEEALHFYKTYLRRAPQGPSSAEAEKRIRELEDAIAHGRK
jgi:tetratricopeptide (TPR) repeat protein